LEEVNKLQKLSESLLRDSRYQKGNYLTKFQKVNLKEVIESSVKSLSRKAKKKEVEVELKLSKADVLGDRVGLEELVAILLDNAIKFSDKGSKVTIRLKKDKKCASMVVSDRGVGILKKDQPYIFKRFYQVASSRSKIKNDGFGLGLSIAKKITKLHNGDISIKSDLGKGSIFSVKIPLA